MPNSENVTRNARPSTISGSMIGIAEIDSTAPERRLLRRAIATPPSVPTTAAIRQLAPATIRLLRMASMIWRV